MADSAPPLSLQGYKSPNIPVRHIHIHPHLESSFSLNLDSSFTTQPMSSKEILSSAKPLTFKVLHQIEGVFCNEDVVVRLLHFWEARNFKKLQTSFMN
ncbi:unnamed protein product [Microthlaspi erraticum]|uniref:Uncharacterized protein n=1 Tax=Microthlaspi erraticum TaxID=1685480 RepID=A0A6D2I8E0_9BRAS|nr:unnamed protein product [Microthlaspi erraticum]